MLIPPDDALADDGTLFWLPFRDERLTLLDQGKPGDLTACPTYHPPTSRSHLPFSDREFSKLLVFRSKHWESAQGGQGADVDGPGQTGADWGGPESGGAGGR